MAGTRTGTRIRARRWLLVLGLSIGLATACTPPPRTPAPLPPPATNDVNPDLAARAGDAAYAEPGPYAAGVTTITVESGRKAEVWYPAPPSSTTGLEPDTYHLKDFLSPFMRSLVPADVD